MSHPVSTASDGRGLRRRFTASAALSLQNSLPGVDPLAGITMDRVRQDWGPATRFEHIQQVLIGGQRFSGWVALTIGGAVIVALNIQ